MDAPSLSRSLVRRIYIHKAPVDIVDPRNLPVVLSSLLSSSGPSRIMFIRTWDLYRAHHDPLLLRTMNNAALVLPVSRMIGHMARFMTRQRQLFRYYPFDSIIRILTWLEDMGGSLYLLGGSASDIVAVDQNVRLTFPKVRLLGRYTAYFPDRMAISVATAIHKADPDILIAGKGLAGRDRWLYRNRRNLNRGIQIWSSEWFDFVIQKRRRPSKPAVRHGREWISELYSHPAKTFRLFPLTLFWLRLLMAKVFRPLKYSRPRKSEHIRRAPGTTD